MNEKSHLVIAEHRASFPYSVKLKARQIVVLTEKEEDGWVWCICKDELGAWVPKEYLAQKGDRGITLIEYDSTELNVQVNERLSCGKEAKGWLWCVNQKGESGWVPKAKLRRIFIKHEKDTY